MGCDGEVCGVKLGKKEPRHLQLPRACPPLFHSFDDTFTFVATLMPGCFFQSFASLMIMKPQTGHDLEPHKGITLVGQRKSSHSSANTGGYFTISKRSFEQLFPVKVSTVLYPAFSVTRDLLCAFPHPLCFQRAVQASRVDIYLVSGPPQAMSANFHSLVASLSIKPEVCGSSQTIEDSPDFALTSGGSPLR
jgi:hypothetical protein